MKSKIIIIAALMIAVQIFPQADNDRLVLGKYITLQSKILNEERRIFIRVPFGYEQTTASYPVLYLLDENTHSIHASGTVSFLSANGVMPQTIIVGIPNTDRSRDFTPTKTEDTPNSGGADNFIRFLKEELIPYIDQNYRTENFRILFGHSLTAMFSIYTLLSNPDLFSGYISASPYVMYDNNYTLELAKKNLPESFDQNKFLYIALGNEPNYFNSINELTGLLKSKSIKGLKWEYTFMEHDDHGTVPLKTIYNALELIYNGWRLPPDLAKTGNLQSVKDHYKNLSEKYGYQVAIPEGTLNLFAYQVMFEKRVKEALEIFEYNILLYPNSANVYDSYGEGLEADNQLQEAKKYYETAYEKGEAADDPNLPFYLQHIENINKKLAQ
ncbi:MAG TPA: alpha/beta hydrolase-fold protein [Ignavibacteriaceae bacterium]|nr:alpha/beta hydrolase-fold protein [Ignavibacteriaceae bacterium]